MQTFNKENCAYFDIDILHIEAIRDSALYSVTQRCFVKQIIKRCSLRLLSPSLIVEKRESKVNAINITEKLKSPVCL